MSVRFTCIYIVIILILFNGLEIVSCLIWNSRFFLVFLSLELTEPRLALNLLTLNSGFSSPTTQVPEILAITPGVKIYTSTGTCGPSSQELRQEGWGFQTSLVYMRVRPCLQGGQRKEGIHRHLVCSWPCMGTKTVQTVPGT